MLPSCSKHGTMGLRTLRVRAARSTIALYRRFGRDALLLALGALAAACLTYRDPHASETWLLGFAREDDFERKPRYAVPENVSAALLYACLADSRPLVVRGLAARWPAAGAGGGAGWSDERLRAAFEQGRTNVKAEKSPPPVPGGRQQFAEYIPGWSSRNMRFGAFLDAVHAGAMMYMAEQAVRAWRVRERVSACTRELRPAEQSKQERQRSGIAGACHTEGACIAP